jgi:hypothetical protein
MSSKVVVDVLIGMEIKERERRRSSPSYCVIERFGRRLPGTTPGVAPLVFRVAASNEDLLPVNDTGAPLPPGAMPLSLLLDRYRDVFAAGHARHKRVERLLAAAAGTEDCSSSCRGSEPTPERSTVEGRYLRKRSMSKERAGEGSDGIGDPNPHSVGADLTR